MNRRYYDLMVSKSMIDQKPTTIDEYFAIQSADAQIALEQIRRTIKESVPEATECIRYAIPTFQLHGKNMVHFAAFAHHVGLYATPDGHKEFEPELSKYKRGKGSVQFPLDRPLPIELIRRITIFRANQINGE